MSVRLITKLSEDFKAVEIRAHQSGQVIGLNIAKHDFHFDQTSAGCKFNLLGHIYVLVHHDIQSLCIACERSNK